MTGGVLRPLCARLRQLKTRLLNVILTLFGL
jgi:hypothetical protein